MGAELKEDAVLPGEGSTDEIKAGDAGHVRGQDFPRRVPAAAVLAVSYAAGSIPFSGIAARVLRGQDLRRIGNGTVSGTSLFAVAGFAPLAAAGCLELAKGAVGPLLAGRDRPFLGAMAAGAAVTAHNWSPLIGFGGGRGLSVAMGACLPGMPEGSLLLGAGMGVGRLANNTGAGSAVAIASLPLLLRVTRGKAGLAAGLCLALPMVVKRLTGNHAPPAPKLRSYGRRLLLDRD